MGRRFQIAVAVLIIALSGAICGCLDPPTVNTSQSCAGDYCDFYANGAVRPYSAIGIVAVVNVLDLPHQGGPGPAVRLLCQCASCATGDSLTLAVSPSLPLGSSVHCRLICGDPVLAEMPSAWGLTSYLWGETPAANQHLTSVLPAGFFQLPQEFGPIVTDPGYSAYEIDLGFPSLPAETIYMHFQYRYNSVPSGFAKGFDVATIQVVESNQHFLYPVGGSSLDFTTLQPPDPRVIALGPGSPVPTHKSTWGGLKMIYH